MSVRETGKQTSCLEDSVTVAERMRQTNRPTVSQIVRQTHRHIHTAHMDSGSWWTIRQTVWQTDGSSMLWHHNIGVGGREKSPKKDWRKKSVFNYKNNIWLTERERDLWRERRDITNTYTIVFLSLLNHKGFKGRGLFLGLASECSLR